MDSLLGPSGYAVWEDTPPLLRPALSGEERAPSAEGCVPPPAGRSSPPPGPDASSRFLPRVESQRRKARATFSPANGQSVTKRYRFPFVADGGCDVVGGSLPCRQGRGKGKERKRSG